MGISLISRGSCLSPRCVRVCVVLGMDQAYVGFMRGVAKSAIEGQCLSAGYGLDMG